MENNANEKEKQSASTASTILDDGSIVEMIFRPDQHRTFFTIYSAGRWTVQDRIDHSSGLSSVPFSSNNNLVKNEVVLLPSEPQIYGGEARLVADVQRFIHRYVDLSPTFQRVATYYVLLTWLYDAFNDLPYLRLHGDYGSGKTRALLTIGSLCYKPFFASGASTVSPIFHTLDAFRGTLIFDEADFRFSDEKAEIVKILNNGNVRGLPVLRTVMNAKACDLIVMASHGDAGFLRSCSAARRSRYSPTALSRSSCIVQLMPDCLPHISPHLDFSFIRETHPSEFKL